MALLAPSLYMGLQMVDKRIMTPGNIPIFNLNEIHYRQAHFS
jgi:hypothetical protein